MAIELTDIKSAMGEQIDAENLADARENLNEWLDLAQTCTKDAVVSLVRAFKASPGPATALMIQSMIDTARKLEQQLNQLISVRGEK